MTTAKQGHTIRLATSERATVSLPVYDATGAAWSVGSATCCVNETPLEVVVIDGVPWATIPPQNDIDTLLLDWTLTGDDTTTREITTTVEIASAHLCSIADIRAYNATSNVDNFADVAIYPDDVVFEARALATDIIESAAGVSFATRKRVWTCDKPARVVNLPDVAVQSVSSDTGRACLMTDRQIVLEGANYPAKITYKYGRPIVPPDIRRACVKLTATILRPLNRPEAATGESTELGYISYTLAGRDGATGIPDVDAAIERHRVKRWEVY